MIKQRQNGDIEVDGNVAPATRTGRLTAPEQRHGPAQLQPRRMVRLPATLVWRVIMFVALVAGVVMFLTALGMGG